MFNEDIMISTLEKAGLISKTYNGFLCGGAIRDMLLGVTPKDFDIFFNDKESYQREVEYYRGRGLVPTAERKNSIQFEISNPVSSLSIDFVYSEFSSVEELVNSFDLTVCCVGFNGSKLVYHNDFIRDLQEKEIKINQVVAVKSTLERLFRFQERGYKVPKETIDKMFEIISKGTTSDGEGYLQVFQLEEANNSILVDQPETDTDIFF